MATRARRNNARNGPGCRSLPRDKRTGWTGTLPAAVSCIPSFPPLRPNFTKGNPGRICNLWIHPNACSGLALNGISPPFLNPAPGLRPRQLGAPEPLRISPREHRVLASSGQTQQARRRCHLYTAPTLTWRRPRKRTDTGTTRASRSLADVKPSLVF